MPPPSSAGPSKVKTNSGLRLSTAIASSLAFRHPEGSSAGRSALVDARGRHFKLIHYPTLVRFRGDHGRNAGRTSEQGRLVELHRWEPARGTAHAAPTGVGAAHMGPRDADRKPSRQRVGSGRAGDHHVRHGRACTPQTRAVAAAGPQTHHQDGVEGGNVRRQPQALAQRAQVRRRQRSAVERQQDPNSPPADRIRLRPRAQQGRWVRRFPPGEGWRPSSASIPVLRSAQRQPLARSPRRPATMLPACRCRALPSRHQLNR